jgi:SAM-dependent methyltransferase
MTRGHLSNTRISTTLTDVTLPVPGEDVLYNPRLRLRYAVRDGVPVLLAGDILFGDETEHRRIVAKAGETAVAAWTEAPPDDGAVTRPVSQYEGHAAWYEAAMADPADRGGLARAGFDILSELLGEGSGVALDIGCGTGRAAEVLRGLGYRPLGVDLAADQLRLAAARLPVVRGTVHELPIASDSLPLAYSTFTTASWGDLGLSLREVIAS